MSQERIPCADRSSSDLVLKTGCTKPLPSLPLRVPSEYDCTGEGAKGGNSSRIKDPIILAPRRETSNISSGSPRPSSPVDSLEALLSNLHLEKAKPELPATDPDPLTKGIPPPEASTELKPQIPPVTPLETSKKSSSISNDTPIRPITGTATCRTLGFQMPYPLAHRALPNESMFLFDSDMNFSTSAGSDHEETQFYFGSLASIEENSQMAPYSQTSNTVFQQQTRISLLSQRLKSQGYAQTRSSIATSPFINQSSSLYSAGQATRFPMHHFMSSSLKTNDQDQYMPLKFDDDLELLLLSPGPEVTSPTSDWSFDQSQVHSKPIPIGIPPTNRFHGRRVSLSNSVRPQHHPYRSPSQGSTAESIFSLGTSVVDHVANNYLPHQQQAALNIFNYKQAHPDTAIPASYITAELAEVYEGRGWCLLGNCGVDRAKQKLNPHYDVSKDTTRKRIDHLYDHIRDKHFNCRPFRCVIAPCTQTFSRQHDLKRHEQTHTSVSLPCEICGKHYTREDNLKRHQQLKHLSVPGTSRGFSGASSRY